MKPNEIVIAPALLGAIAVLCAALISALTVMLAALVNTRSARRIARETHRRELLSASLAPFTKRLDEQIGTLRRFHRAVIETHNALREIPTSKPAERAKISEDVLSELASVKSMLAQSDDIWHETDGLSVIYRDQRLIDNTSAWLNAKNDCMKALIEEGKQFGGDGKAIQRLSKAVHQISNHAVVLRIAIEEVIIEPPGPISVALYSLKRRFKKNVGWEKLPTT